MADNKISLPQSGGGLVRYSETAGSKIQMKPATVVVIIVAVIVISIILHILKPFL